ncbi:hypothetical protein MUK42_08251 [Musa troglodytarum]|uniref:Uncharacterized protein n=1 Tax=Musa troglodytarum TaxID=320322 RepID=A0A9E7E960_9LILI|nr:hypothetical protein MUK42_08251 [Musa troglodytarum]
MVAADDDLVQGCIHLCDAPRDAAFEVVVGQNHDGDLGVAQVFRQGGVEPVVVQEQGVKILVEDLGRQWPLEVVEAEVEVAELGQLEHLHGERPDEAVVAQVELLQLQQVGEVPRNLPLESVRVDVDEGDLVQEAELDGEVAGEVGAIEVEACHRVLGGVAERGSADDAVVGAHVMADPVAGEVVGIRDDGSLPGVDGGVGAFEQRVADLVIVRDGGRDWRHGRHQLRVCGGIRRQQLRIGRRLGFAAFVDVRRRLRVGGGRIHRRLGVADCADVRQRLRIGGLIH